MNRTWKLNEAANDGFEPSVLHRRTYLESFKGAVAMMALTGCLGGGGNGGEGYLTSEIRAGGGEIQDFETLTLLITEIHLEPMDGERISIDVHETQADLVKLQDDWAKPIGSTSDRGIGGIREPLEAREYQSLQLGVEEIIEATLNDGNEATVMTPADGLLPFDVTFEIRDGEYATFVAVVAPVRQDDSDEYVLNPVTDAVEITQSENQ